MKVSKIQSLLITHLTKYGTIQLNLPDNMVLEIGITAEKKDGAYEKIDDYCWVIAKKENKATCIDSYNLGIRFNEEDHNMYYTKIYRLYYIKNIMPFNCYYFDKRFDPSEYNSYMNEKMIEELYEQCR